MIVRVWLSNDEMRQCRAWAAEVMANLPDRPSYTGLEDPERYFVGYRGEVAVCNWLQHNKLPAVHTVDTSGQSQPSELVVDRHRLEVKTASSPDHQKLMAPEKQPFDFAAIVGARLGPAPNIVDICGWLSLAQFRLVPVEMVKIPTRSFPLGQLASPESLIDALRFHS